MEHETKDFEIEKTFGLGVLLKLTKKSEQGIEISTTGNKFRANVPLETLKDAVNKTIETHHITLKIK